LEFEEIELKNEADLVSESDVDKIFAKTRLQKRQEIFDASQPFFMRLAILIGAVFLLALYWFMPMSRVKSVVITGNSFLSTEYVSSVSRITTDNRFYAVIPAALERRLERDPMIESAKVTLEEGNVISIAVTEKKPIGYRYDEEPVILLSDNTTAELKSEYLDLISEIPLITGFEEEEQTRLLCKAFEDVDESAIRDMSEVSQYALSYDDEAIRILMRTGGYFISDYFSLATINQYSQFYGAQTDHSYCIYAVDQDQAASAYSAACPWSETADDFWTDAEGNPVVNSQGITAYRHYYKDPQGNPALDANGNQIVIPIDENGDEVEDPDFQANYAAGYYASGTLQIP